MTNPNTAYAVKGVDMNWILAVAASASLHNMKTLNWIDRITFVALEDYPGARDLVQRVGASHIHDTRYTKLSTPDEGACTAREATGRGSARFSVRSPCPDTCSTLTSLRR